MMSGMNLLQICGHNFKVRLAIMGQCFPSSVFISEGACVHWMERWITPGLGFCHIGIKN